MQRLTFEQWKKRNQDLVDAQVKCDECNGTGVTICACCGAEKDCETCEGTGKVIATADGRKATLGTLYWWQYNIDDAALDALNKNKPVLFRDIEQRFLAAH